MPTTTKLRLRTLTRACVLAGLVFFTLPLGQAHAQPPVQSRRENVVDIVHGQKIFDPYRWLENGDSAEVADWTRKQNQHTSDLLKGVPGRAALEQRLWQLHESGQIGTPVVRGTRGKPLQIFYTRRTGKQNQPVLYTRALEAPASGEKVLLDVNQAASDGTLSLDWWFASDDAHLLAYGTSRDGTEESTLRVRNVATGQDLPDVIERTRACSLAWLPDGSGFYYTSYPAPGTVPDEEIKYHRAVYFHRIGDSQDRDEKIFPSPAQEPTGKRDMTDWPGVSITPGGRHVVIEVSQGWTRSELHLLDRKAQGKRALQPLVTGKNAIYSVSDLDDDRILVLSNDGAPRYRLWQINPARPGRESWKELIPEGKDTLERVSITGKQLTALYLQDASSRVRIFDNGGKQQREVSLPGLGSTEVISGRGQDGFFFYNYYSFLTPNTIYRHDLRKGTSTLWERTDVPINDSDFVVQQVRYPSSGCAQIPMFIVHKKGVQPRGDNPTVLYGYGGFNISLTPRFAAALAPFLEAGGVYAVANLRGGGEYGEDWHKAGMLQRKQNVFDDFIAAGQFLIAEKWTNRNKLAIMGRSNGGLLIGAAVTQRPDLFRVAISGVPLLDMVRYHMFRIARLWIPEYGDPDSAADFAWLYAYSPYHRIKAGTRYPATMFVTAASDTRVDAMHARKMAARLQLATASPHPILLRLETQAGHGAGKPLGKSIEQYTDELAFLFRELGMTVR